MYLRTVLRSRSSCRAIAETDSPCRCKSKIITSSPSRITAPPLPPIGRDHSGHRRSARRRASRGAPREPRRHTWGIFKRRFWGESLRRRQADGATVPAWNVQVATSNGFIVGIDPTDRRRDSGLAPGMIDRIVEHCGRVPQRVLADTTAMTRQDIVGLAERYPDVTVYSPPPPERTDVTAAMLRTRRCRRRREPPPVQAWRARMASEDGRQTYRRRKLTERLHGIIKNRGMSRFLVHGREKVRAVCLLHALALNLGWANTLRRRLAAATAMAMPAAA